MGKNMLRLLKFALKYPWWHSYGKDESTVKALNRLVNLGLIRTNKFRMFRVVIGGLENERETAADEVLYEWDESRDGHMKGYGNWEKGRNHWSTSVTLTDETTVHFSVRFVQGAAVVSDITNYVKD